MHIFYSEKDLSSFLLHKKDENLTIGFVPTMGVLHQGHLSLIEKSKKENDLTICSIYVNPTQFNNASDLENYPVTLEDDKASLKKSECDILFLPSTQDMYPQGAKSDSFDFGNIELLMEGAHRPGHFDGVGTVISRFFDILKPNKAYFGEKDFQQLAIIRKLVELKNYPVEIIGCPIFRENDGLAMSSRNVRLNHSQRKAAADIFKALEFAKNNFNSFAISELKKEVENRINSNPELDVEYIEIADDKTLHSAPDNSNSKGLRIFTAVFAGEVRLIDNEALN